MLQSCSNQIFLGHNHFPLAHLVAEPESDQIAHGHVLHCFMICGLEQKDN